MSTPVYLLYVIGIPALCWWNARRYNQNPILWVFLAYGLFWFAPVVQWICSHRGKSVDKYIAENPGIANGRGLACNKCGSQSIRLWKQRRLFTTETQHLCNHCGTHLYSS